MSPPGPRVTAPLTGHVLAIADFARRAEGVCWLSVCIQIGHSRAPRWAPALLRRGARRSRPGFGRLAYSGRLHAGLATPHGTSTRTRSADGRWVWNPVSSPVNRYHVLFKAIENLRTPASPEEHLALALAVTGTKTDTLVRGSCHQPCLSQLLIPSLPHRRQKRRQAEACPVGSATAAQADPPVEKLQPHSAWARVELSRPPHAAAECCCPPRIRSPDPARVPHSAPMEQQEG